jgi:dsDNA-binding SOS-regulon protein
MATYSNIGTEQRKYTALRTKAEHYRQMGLAIQLGTLPKVLGRHTFPKYVPRGKAPEWYYAKADKYERQSDIADTLASALSDARHQEWLDTRTSEEAAMWIDNGREYICQSIWGKKMYHMQKCEVENLCKDL